MNNSDWFDTILYSNTNCPVFLANRTNPGPANIPVYRCVTVDGKALDDCTMYRSEADGTRVLGLFKTNYAYDLGLLVGDEYIHISDRPCDAPPFYYRDNGVMDHRLKIVDKGNTLLIMSCHNRPHIAIYDRKGRKYAVMIPVSRVKPMETELRDTLAEITDWDAPAEVIYWNIVDGCGRRGNRTVTWQVDTFRAEEGWEVLDTVYASAASEMTVIGGNVLDPRRYAVPTPQTISRPTMM
jgi:hypothetical protein